MSDTTYNKFQHYGTNAERLAFIPDPPVGTGLQPIYIWYETDTGDTFLYHTAWIALAGSGIVPPPRTGFIEFLIDGGGSVITTGFKGHIEMPTSTIEAVTLVGDATGSIVVDLKKDTFPPSGAVSITSATPPTISGADSSQDNTLTGWTTSFTEGELLEISVPSVATFTKVTLSLKVQVP